MTWEEQSSDNKIIIDEASTTLTYIGEALAGTLTSQPDWKVKRIDESTNPTTITFADGNTNYDNVFDDRASLTYS